MILFYAFDEYTDIENGAGAQGIRDILTDAIHHPDKPRPVGEVPLGELARQYATCAMFLTP
jgi:hypothetical protein